VVQGGFNAQLNTLLAGAFNGSLADTQGLHYIGIFPTAIAALLIGQQQYSGAGHAAGVSFALLHYGT
jgi:hypothetical protein